jgi:signal peptidase
MYIGKNMEINYTEPVVVSLLFLFIFLLFYLYKHENKYIINILSWQYKTEQAKLEKDTRLQDWLILILLVFLIVIMGVKLLTFTVIISDSMKPEFQRGDMVLMQTIFKEPQVGDIITFSAEDTQYGITHRVVSVDGSITTRGDNNPYKDNYETTQDKVLLKAIIVNNHPIVIKGLGSLFITDYSKQGTIYKYGDQFTFLQQLSATIRAWGYVITIIALLAYIMSMKK